MQDIQLLMRGNIFDIYYLLFREITKNNYKNIKYLILKYLNFFDYYIFKFNKMLFPRNFIKSPFLI